MRDSVNITDIRELIAIYIFSCDSLCHAHHISYTYALYVLIRIEKNICILFLFQLQLVDYRLRVLYTIYIYVLRMCKNKIQIYLSHVGIHITKLRYVMRATNENHANQFSNQYLINQLRFYEKHPLFRFDGLLKLEINEKFVHEEDYTYIQHTFGIVEKQNARNIFSNILLVLLAYFFLVKLHFALRSNVEYLIRWYDYLK